MEAQQTEVIASAQVATARSCPACGAAHALSFYSCVLMRSREEALAYPRGEIDLCFCGRCGFIFNRSFDPPLIEYSERHEETQGFSDTFNAFHKALAERLIERYNLHGKNVIEIGCGKGEFLAMLCELGPNRGTGFDASYVAARSRATKTELATFVTDFYSERYADREADFICCKMTLEHIPTVAKFVDINPHRQEMFMSGTGHSIVSPDFLTRYKLDRVIIMNPIYREEITKMLKERGVAPVISTVVEPA